MARRAAKRRLGRLLLWLLAAYAAAYGLYRLTCTSTVAGAVWVEGGNAGAITLVKVFWVPIQIESLACGRPFWVMGYGVAPVRL